MADSGLGNVGGSSPTYIRAAVEAPYPTYAVTAAVGIFALPLLLQEVVIAEEIPFREGGLLMWLNDERGRSVSCFAGDSQKLR